MRIRATSKSNLKDVEGDGYASGCVEGCSTLAESRTLQEDLRGAGGRRRAVGGGMMAAVQEYRSAQNKGREAGNAKEAFLSGNCSEAYEREN